MNGLLEAYEGRTAQEIGVDHAIAFNNARTALLGILAAAGLGGTDEVLLSPLTCEVVPLALLSHPIRPVYSEIAPGSLNLDAAALDGKRSPATRAVLFQHTYGTSSGWQAVADFANRHSLLLIADCAQSMPHALEHPSPGRLGHAAIFSLNLVKPLPAGSGGMAVTDDAGLATRIRAYRDRLPAREAVADRLQRFEGLLQRIMLNPATYWDALAVHGWLRRGRGATLERAIESRIRRSATRISTAQARLGLRAMAAAPRVARARAENTAWYASQLGGWPTVELGENDPAPLFYYPLLTPHKRELLERARRRRIEVVAWPDYTLMYGVDDPRMLTRYAYTPGNCPVAEQTAAQLVGLPTGPDVTPGHRRRIARLIKEVSG